MNKQLGFKIYSPPQRNACPGTQRRQRQHYFSDYLSYKKLDRYPMTSKKKNSDKYMTIYAIKHNVGIKS